MAERPDLPTPPTKRRTDAARALLLPLIAASALVPGCDSAADPVADTPASELLTAGPTADEVALKADEADPRDSMRAYMYTEAPNDVLRLPGEFEPVSKLFLAYQNTLTDLFVDIIRTSLSEAAVTVLYADPKHATRLRSELTAGGVDPDAVTFKKITLDSVWVRDWGPQLVDTLDGGQRVIDTRYYPGRYEDDVFPTRLALERGLPSSRPALATEGGNLLADGAGSCIISSTVRTRGGTTLARLEALYLASYGCERLIELDPLEGEPTGHVDMFVTVTGHREAIVGQYDESQDDINWLVLEIAASALENDGFEVRRVPMPDNDRRRRFRTYTNAVAVNGVVLVPVYPGHDAGEAAALATFAQAYPDRTIVPIDATAAIEAQGSIHCLTSTLPKTTETAPAAGPCVGLSFGASCDDGYCDGRGACVAGPVPDCPCFTATEVDAIGRHKRYPHGVATCEIEAAATDLLAQRTAIGDYGLLKPRPDEMFVAASLLYPDRSPGERFACAYEVTSATDRALEERHEVLTEEEHLACRALVEARIDALGCLAPTP